MEFSRRHPEWLRKRQSESDVVYRLPEAVLSLLGADLKLDRRDLTAEAAFDRLCLRVKAVAVWNNRPIPYRWLLPTPAPIPQPQIEGMTSLGLTPEQVRRVPEVLQRMGDMSERSQSIAGRRISDPQFLAACDHLRHDWNSLADAERPELPLSRTQKCEAEADWSRADGAPDAMGEFCGKFEDFCRRWGLLGMATWDLPDPGELMWPDLTQRPQLSRADEVTFRTPLDFPMLESDGLGEIARDQHAASANKAGIVDLRRWETYARFLEIDHWERVLRTRYTGGERPRNYVTFLEATIGKIVDLDVERVHKLRKWMRALKSGRRTNLASCR